MFLNYRQIAQLTDPPISHSHVYRVLTGESIPSVHTLRNLARVLGCSIETLNGYLIGCEALRAGSEYFNRNGDDDNGNDEVE